MGELEKKINDIIAEWNPLRVDSAISQDEYREYIPIIVDSIGDYCGLRNAIERILEMMGIDISLDCVKSDVNIVCKSISDLK